VWICRCADGHVQAVGRDEAGRRQYIYHPDWIEGRAQRRSERMRAFGWLLPRIRRQVAADLRREGLARRRILAAVTRLLDSTLARIGNVTYAREHGTYGLTTVRKKHVSEGGAVIEFPGKGGTPWSLHIEDPRVLAVVRACLRTPGYRLFKFIDGGDEVTAKAGDVNAYLAEVARQPVSAKDFRTWGASTSAMAAMADLAGHEDDAEPRDVARRAIDRAAAALENTRAVCRSSYVCPDVVDDVPTVVEAIARAEDRVARAPAELDAEEMALLSILSA